MTKKTSKPETVLLERGLGAFVPELAKTPPTDGAQSVRIPLSAIVIPKELEQQVPLQEDRVQALAASIRERGLEVDIQVRPHGELFELIDGRHRLAAFQALGQPDIPAKVRHDLVGDELVVARAVINFNRRGATPWEEALAFRDMNAAGKTQEQVAQLCGVSLGTVKNRLRLLALPEDLGQRIGQDPGLTAQHAVVLVPFAEHPKLLAEAKKCIGAKDWDGQVIPAEHFGATVQQHLEKKGLLVDAANWRLRQVADTKVVKDAIAAAPKVNLGTGKRARELLVDVGAALGKAVEQAERERDQREAARLEKLESAGRKGSKASAAEAKQAAEERRRRLEVDADRAAGRMQRVMLKKAAAACEQFGPREVGLLVKFLAYKTRYDDDWADALSEITGVSIQRLRDCADRGAYDDGENEGRVGLMEELYAAKDQRPAVRLAVGLALRQLVEEHVGEPWDGPKKGHKSLLQVWTGSSYEDLEKKALADLKERAKLRDAGKVPKAPKATEDERRVACPACDAMVGKWCVDNTRHVMRTFHAARVAAAAAKELAKPTAANGAKGKGKKAPGHAPPARKKGAKGKGEEPPLAEVNTPDEDGDDEEVGDDA